MVYKRYIKKKVNGKIKIFGPYYYESYRDKKGIARTKYVNKPKKTFIQNNAIERKYWTLLFVGVLALLFVLLFTINNISNNNVNSIDIQSKISNINEKTKTFYNKMIIPAAKEFSHFITGFVPQEDKEKKETEEEKIKEDKQDENEIKITESKETEQEEKEETVIDEPKKIEEPVINKTVPEQNTTVSEQNPESNIIQNNTIEQNITIVNETTSHITSLNETSINITIVNETISNITIINETLTNETITNLKTGNITINTIQYGAVINKPVKWKKNIKLDNVGEIKVEIPKEANNITVYKLLDGEQKEEINETESSTNDVTQTEQDNTPVNEQPNITNTLIINSSSSVTSEQQITTNNEQIDINKEQEKIKEEVSDDKIKITAKIISAGVISGKISAEIELDKEKSVIASFFKKLFNRITGKAIDVTETQEIKEVVINENATEFEIEYETPAPVSYELNISTGKEVIISGPDTLHYENVLAFTELPREIPANSINSIKLYHIVEEIINITDNQLVSDEIVNATSATGQVISSNINETTNQIINIVKIPVNFEAYDTNNNSLIDYIEWLVPSLSNQSYELIIEITKAEHLDSNRTFISDIYNEVKALDGNWSETINNNEYVRVTFEQPLDNTRDITLYPRIVNGSNETRIEVYEIDGNEIIAEFNNIIDNQYNKVYLTNLSECYDNETKIFTEQGWKYFSELDKTEKVATLNPETHETEFHKPYHYQTYEHNDEMYKIILEDGSELLVSPEHKVYAGEETQILRNFLKSSVLNILTEDCFLKLGLLDQIAQFNFNASANTGISLSCVNCFALASNCLNNSLDIISMNSGSSDNTLLNCSELSLEYFNTSNLFFFNSSIEYCGEDNLKPIRSEFTIINLTGLSLKNESNIFVSTTNCIFYHPSFLYLFHIPSLILSPSFKQSSSVNSEFSSILSNFLSNKALLTFSDKNLRIDSDTFSSGSSSNCFFNSSGMDKVMFGILLPSDILNSVYSVKDVQVYKSFSLQPITEVYSEFNNNKQIYFLDSENNPIKISSITKENYKGKIYDVTVDNHIILVKRKNSSAIWSGNSQTQDVFDLRVINGNVEFEHIIDPTINSSTTNLTIWTLSDTQTVYSNYTKFFANYTNTSGSTINGSTIWCEFRHNKTGIWKDLANMSFNPATLQYEIIADGKYISNSTESHRDGMPYGNYSFNVSCFDSSSAYTNLSLAGNVSISLYTTNLLIVNDSTTPQANQNTYFYADYNSSMHPVSGVGLNSYKIGQVVWNTSDLDTFYSTKLIDLDNDGRKDEVFIGADGDIFAFYENGTQIWTSNYPLDNVNDIAIGDFNNNSFYSDIAISDMGGYVWVFNRSGGMVWNSSLLGNGGIARAITVGDLDRDGISGDIVASFENNSGNYVMAWNTSNSMNWSVLWVNYIGTTATIANEIIIGDADSDGFDDVIVAESGSSLRVFIGLNGSLIFNTTDVGSGLDSVVMVDLDHDSNEDEILIVEGSGKFYGFAFNGTYGVMYNHLTDAIISSSVPYNNFFEINIFDFDNDGFRDDIVLGDDGGSLNHGIIWAFDNNSNYIWHYNVSYSLASTDYIYNLLPMDIDNDGYEEIIFSSENEPIIWVLNKSGSLLWSYSPNLSAIGGWNVGKNSGLDISDVNKDGIKDIAVALFKGEFILQDVKCIARFNDSTNHNMTWNNSISRWQTNKSFSSSGTFNWNVTCEKGGYQTQTTLSNITISSVDSIPPNITINSPLNQTYNTATILFNITALDDTGMSTCLYTLTNGITNYTMSNTSSIWNATNSTMSQGSSTVRFYCNDTSNNLNNSETRTFVIDTIQPSISITTPLNNTFTSDTLLDVNYTVSDAGGISSCWYSNDTMSVNTSLTSSCNNITTITWSEGQHNVTIWVNDTSNNVNSTLVGFTIDATAPYNINLNAPANNSVQTNPVNFNWTVSDNLATTLTCNLTIDSVVNVSNILSNNGTATNKTVTGFSVASHLWNVTCWDNATNTNTSVTNTFTISSVDSIPPNITINSPLNQTYNTATILFNITALDDTGMSTCLYTLTNGITNYTMSNTSSIWNATNSTMSQGSSTVRFYCNDTSNNLNNSETRTFVIDTIQPSISITTPLNNTFTSDPNLDVNYTASDANLGSCWYSNDTMSFNYSLANCGTNITTITWSEGQHNVTIWVNDTSNNVNSTSVRFTIDATTPQINIIYPLNTTYNINISQLNYTYSDTNTGVCWYSTNSGATNSSIQTPSVNFTNVISTEGSNTWKLYCNDSANNLNTSSITFFKDTVYPLIDYGTGTANSSTYYSRNWIFVNVSVTETNFKNITFNLFNITGLVNSTSYTTQTYNINFTSLIDGNYSINATIYDDLENKNSTSTRNNIMLDITPPAINFTSPTETNNSYLIRNNTLINVTSTDNNLANITINLYNSTSLVNSTITLTSPNFVNITNLIDGVYYFNSTSIDLANNRNNTQTRTITLDSAYPIITLISPADAYSSTDTSVAYQYNVTDTSSTNCSLILDGAIINFNSSVNISGGTNTFINSTSVASHTWNINCTDSMNNIINSSSRTFTITSAPSSSSTSSGGGGGGIPPITKNFEVDKEQISVKLKQGETSQIEFTLSNTGTTSLDLSINSSLGDMMKIKDSFSLEKGESKTIKIDIIAREDAIPNIYLGKIFVSSGNTIKEILVSIEVVSKESLFDVVLEIPKKYQSVLPGEEISFKVSLIRMIELDRKDVVINYTVKNENGDIVIFSEDTKAIETSMSFIKELKIPEETKHGKHVLYVQVIYEGKVASTSDWFNVVDEKKSNIIWWVLIGFLIISIIAITIIIIVLFRRKNIKK